MMHHQAAHCMAGPDVALPDGAVGSNYDDLALFLCDHAVKSYSNMI